MNAMRYALVGFYLTCFLLDWLTAHNYRFLIPVVLSLYLIYVFLAWAMESEQAR